MRKSSWLLSLAMVAGLVALVGGPATAGHPGTTVFVDAANCPGPGDGSEGDPFCSIQAGVNHANNGDTVSVAAGTYAAEPGNQVQINQNNLTLEGAKAGVPAGPAASPANRGSDESVLMGRFHFSQNRPGTVIDGFWVESGLMSGINALRGVPATAVNNVLRGTPASSGIQAGILVQNLNQHYIAHNNIQGYRQGINADGGLTSAQSVIEKNYLANTTLSTIFFNSGLSNGHIIRENVLEDNATGIFVTQGEHEIHMNTVQNGTGNGIAVLATARTFGLDISGNDLFNNLRGISLSGDHADAVDNEGHNNNIVGNGMGVLSTHSALFNAECNWWGSATGPTDPAGNPTGTGDSSTGNVDYTPWLIAPAPGGACEGPLSSMDQKQMVRDELAAMLPTGDEKDDKEIEKAIEKIDKSLDPELWVDDETLDPKDGKKVFDEEKKAVKHLEKVDTVDVSSQIDSLVDIDRQLAENAMEDADQAIAAAAGGDPKELEKAQKERDKADEELAKGDEERADGDNDKAIDKYKKAWEKAQKAIEHANKA